MPRKSLRSKKALQTFARNMRSRRQAAGLSQMALADKAGCHFTFIGRLERAESNVTLDNIVRIAKSLDCKVVELLSGL